MDFSNITTAGFRFSLPFLLRKSYFPSKFGYFPLMASQPLEGRKPTGITKRPRITFPSNGSSLKPLPELVPVALLQQLFDVRRAVEDFPAQLDIRDSPFISVILQASPADF